MKTLNIIKYAFTIIGAGMLIGTLFIYLNTNKFLATCVLSEGTVIDLVSSRSDDSYTYSPIVQFEDQYGNQVLFHSSNGSNPPSYSVGETVEVLFDPESPDDAKINGFFSLWGGVLILGILGTVFFAVGGAIIYFGVKRSNLVKYLKQNGTKVISDFQSVVVNTSMSVNGRHPYQIVSQWQDPVTTKLHIFTSDNIWFDPINFIKTEKINVLIDRRSPQKYMVDLSFLPELSS